ncbi:MAG: class IV adenylate cyclase, partial [Candidatus Magasanikbacteria bacterium]|nr:class IV adenylate cyclase [Candidatus Magasanikbacteria bacterium]
SCKDINMQNKLNLELKYFCPDFSPIRKVLSEIGAKKIIVKNQKDYFFNLPLKKTNPRLKLRIEGKNQTLVYYERPNFKENKANSAKVILFPVKDKKLFKFLSETLGVKAIVIKTRELWEKDNAIFNLDDVKSVGKIFEIEITTNEENKDKAQKSFNNYQKKFRPHLAKIIKGSNLDLVSRTGK